MNLAINKLVSEGLKNKDIDNNALGYYYLYMDSNQIDILDLMDFTWESFPTYGYKNKLHNFICNNPTKFVNLDTDTKQFHFSCTKKFKFKYGVVRWLDKEIVQINYKGVNHLLRCVNEGSCVNILYDDTVLLALRGLYFKEFSFTGHLAEDIKICVRTISTDSLLVSWNNPIIYFDKEGMHFYQDILDTMSHISSTSLSINVTESIKDCINRGFCNEDLVLHYINRVLNEGYITKDILGTCTKLKEYYPSQVSDRDLVILTKKLFLKRGGTYI